MSGQRATERLERAAGYKIGPRIYYGRCLEHGKKVLAGYVPARSPLPVCTECGEPYERITRD